MQARHRAVTMLPKAKLTSTKIIDIGRVQRESAAKGPCSCPARPPDCTGEVDATSRCMRPCNW